MVEKTQTLSRISDEDVQMAALQEIGYICTLFEASQYVSSKEIPHAPEAYLDMILEVLEDARLIG
jgi:hypothetical protein